MALDARPHPMADAQDRNLPASPKKIRKAREDGQVARSRDLAHLLVVGGGGALLAAVVPMLGDWLHRLLVTGLRFDARFLARDDAMTTRLGELTWSDVMPGRYKRTEKVLPWPGMLVTVSSPPMSCVSRLVIVRPRPVPDSLARRPAQPVCGPCLRRASGVGKSGSYCAEKSQAWHTRVPCCRARQPGNHGSHRVRARRDELDTG